MVKQNVNDLSGLLRFIKQDGWEAEFELVLAEHLDDLFESLDELAGLADTDTVMAVWGCVFEDFVTRSFGAKGNIIDVYLPKRGWREGPGSRAYMKALRTSVISVYAISDVVPGTSFKARDLIRGGDPVTVYEGTASRTLGAGHVLAARVVTVLGKVGIAGGIMGFPDGAVALLEMLKEFFGKTEDAPWRDIGDDRLRSAAPLVSQAWLEIVMDQAMEDEDDEAADLIVEVEFSLARKAKVGDVVAALGTAAQLELCDVRTWLWMDTELDQDGIEVELGVLELEDRKLILTVDDDATAEVGIAMLQATLGKLIGKPKITRETMDDLLSDPELMRLFAEGLGDEEDDELVVEDEPANDR